MPETVAFFDWFFAQAGAFLLTKLAVAAKGICGEHDPAGLSLSSRLMIVEPIRLRPTGKTSLFTGLADKGAGAVPGICGSAASG
jgi:hypothetical protein